MTETDTHLRSLHAKSADGSLGRFRDFLDGRARLGVHLQRFQISRCPFAPHRLLLGSWHCLLP